MCAVPSHPIPWESHGNPIPMDKPEYWCLAMDMFPKLCEKALNVLIPFATTYLCLSGFSALLSIKTKSRNHLSAQVDMRVAISNNVLRFEKLRSNKREQKSH